MAEGRNTSEGYIQSADLERAFEESLSRLHQYPKSERDDRAPECMTPELASMLMQIAEGVGRRKNFAGYSWIEDMIGDALVRLTRRWHRYDAKHQEKQGNRPNPFAYYTQVVANEFQRRIKKERADRRRELIVAQEAGVQLTDADIDLIETVNERLQANRKARRTVNKGRTGQKKGQADDKRK